MNAKTLSLVVFVSTVSMAADKYVGTIETTSAGASKNNSTTARSFTLNQGGRYSIQCDVEACVSSSKTSTEGLKCSGYSDPGDGGSMWLGGADAGVAIKLPKKVIFDIPLAASDAFINVVTVTGNAICDVYSVTP